jgi:hypothetical protein
VLLLLPIMAAVADAPSEDSVKAAFVLNFAKYAEWPAVGMGGNELRLCVIGQQTLSGKLTDLAGSKVQGRELRVRQVSRPEEWRECHLLFIPATEAHRLGALGSATPTLTIGDGADFAQAGGMIGLKQRASRIRFDINLAAARKAGVGLSSQLLKLADEVIQ